VPLWRRWACCVAVRVSISRRPQVYTGLNSAVMRVGGGGGGGEDEE
jgi:hypothetical protein